jgi:hypothetical protein
MVPSVGSRARDFACPLGWLGLALVLGAAPAAPPAVAQDLTGRVLEEGTDTPVPMAGVYLLDRRGRVVRRTLADGLGRFSLEVPRTADYYLRVEGFGYRTLTSLLLRIPEDRAYELDLEVRPEPVMIDPLEVTVRNDVAVRQVRRLLGSNPAALGGKVLLGRELDRLKRQDRDLVYLLRYANLPGVTVGTGSYGTCVQTRGACARVYFDGVQIPRSAVDTVDPYALGAVVLLDASEAGVLFGTADDRSGSAGATLLLFTRGFLARPPGDT